MTQSIHTDTIIIGASAAGLACAACLTKWGIPYILLEQHGQVASEWLHRYDRLHLHTPNKHSELPYFKLPAHFGRYVSKNDFVNYLEQYCHAFNIQPRFHQKVLRAERNDEGWHVSASSDKFISKHLIIATGFARKAVQPKWKGMENFQGKIIHSTQYKNGEVFKNKNVLIVGFGNSACEIALCLHEHRAKPSLSVRNAVNVIPRDLASIPITSIVIAESWLTKISPALTDVINKPILRLLYGNLEKWGLKKLPYGPVTQVTKYKKIPLLDIGTMHLIKNGSIKICPGIDHITHDGVKFTDGSHEPFDVIIAATGYQPAISEFLPEYDKVTDEQGIPLVSGRESSLPGLYFCGFCVKPTGMLREIGIEAKRIGKTLAGN